MVVIKELGQHARLGQLPQVEDGAPSFSNQVKVLRKGPRILHERVVWPRDRLVDHAPGPLLLLPGLHAHGDLRNEDVVVREEDVRLVHHEPFAGIPGLLEMVIFRELEAALHANNRLVVLAHGQLLQVVVRLEEDRSDASPSQPLRLEALHLRPMLERIGGPHRVEREVRLGALRASDLERQGEVLQVDGARGLEGLLDPDHPRLLVPRQAAETSGPRIATQPHRKVRAGGNPLRLPTEAILHSVLLLGLGSLLQTLLVCLP
mmetsp:Transcript_21219/g.63730  ORF Transcript_21219/g.63730 Transcript_21219/m.63730 type:complete len:262 (+) Transcript_21219:1772-2557(+)